MELKNINHIPSKPGIYFFKDKKNQILYIGKAKNLQKRISQYFSIGSLRKQDMLSKADKIDFLEAGNESEALYLEDNLIKKHKPEYNNLLKGDNSYAYIKITKDQFPLIYLTRKKINDGSIYIGPKHNNVQLKNFLQYLRQILKFRGCSDNQFKQGKLCSDYYFAICKGRCNKKVTRVSDAAEATKASKEKKHLTNFQFQVPNSKSSFSNYKKLITQIISFFKGNTKPIEKEIKSQIDDAIKNQNFEWAGKLRDIYLHIQQLVERQTVVLNNKLTGYIFQIKQISDRQIYCVLNFYDGKLIDVITGKENINDLTQEELIIHLQSEFSQDNEFSQTNKALFNKSNKDLSTTKVFQIQKKSDGVIGLPIKKLSKKVSSEINSLLEKFLDSYITSQSFQNNNILTNDLLTSLQQRYNLKNFPYHIECVDISHLSGGRASGGLSCFQAGIKNPKGYRRYKIKGNKGFKVSKVSKEKNNLTNSKFLIPASQSDDYLSLSELIQRRFENRTSLPNLFIIDGGKGQLGIIKKIYKKNSEFKKLFDQIDFVSLGKGQARKKSNIGKKNISEKLYYFDEKFNVKSQNLKYDQIDKILLTARDEAHRFANVYRKKQMSKERK